MRLIDADELKTAFPASENSTPVLIASVRATINHMPTIELERMRGKWIRQDNKGKPLYGWYHCSECGAVIGGKTDFCSECGADMREVVKND